MRLKRRLEALELLKRGYSPSQIAGEMGVTTDSVMGLLYYLVGEGRIRRSDIVLSISEAAREEVEDYLARRGGDHPVFERLVRRETGGLDPEDLRVYLQLRDARAALGDMYEYMREIESFLHGFIKKTLVAHFAEEWWKKGVPESIRVECVTLMERDTEATSDPYCYTTLMNLKDIIERRWNVFCDVLPRSMRSKTAFSADLARLNQIRNLVMHPAKGKNPTEKDFVFVHRLRERFGLQKPPDSADQASLFT